MPDCWEWQLCVAFDVFASNFQLKKNLREYNWMYDMLCIKNMVSIYFHEKNTGINNLNLKGYLEQVRMLESDMT